MQYSSLNKLLSKIYENTKQYNKAIPLLIKSFEIDTKIAGEYSPESVCDSYELLEIKQKYINSESKISKPYFFEKSPKPYFLGFRELNSSSYDKKIKLFCKL